VILTKDFVLTQLFQLVSTIQSAIKAKLKVVSFMLGLNKTFIQEEGSAHSRHKPMVAE